jgi:hypothetical protein
MAEAVLGEEEEASRVEALMLLEDRLRPNRDVKSKQSVEKPFGVLRPS